MKDQEGIKYIQSVRGNDSGTKDLLENKIASQLKRLEGLQT